MRIKRSYPRFSPSPFCSHAYLRAHLFCIKIKSHHLSHSLTCGNVWLSGYTKAKLKLSLLFLLQ
nr:MAG TPA: hypothetical protein [Caudoviricetes sp.]